MQSASQDGAAATSSFWPAAALKTYTAPFLPTSTVSFSSPPPSPALCDAYDALAAPLVSLSLPRSWPDPAPSFSSRVHTRVQLVWNEEGLHALYRMHGPFKSAADDPADKMSRMHDSRLEMFVCPSSSVNRYFAFELNSAGRALDFVATLTSPVDAELDFSHSGHARGVTAAFPQQAEYQHLYLLSVPWQDVTEGDSSQPAAPAATAAPAWVDSVNGRDMRVGFFRGEVIADEDGKAAAAYPSTHLWQSWIDPDSDRVNFHTTRVFAALRLRQ